MRPCRPRRLMLALRRGERLRALSGAESEVLLRGGRSDSEPASHVTRAKGLHAVAADEGHM